MKGKIQAAPKELLRRGLLTGTEKLKGQLRDAAEGGRREDTEADRVQDTARMGACLAVDKLCRLALGKKKARSRSGEAGEPQAGSDPSAPGTQIEPSTPHGGTEPVRIKTRDAVHDAPTVEYGHADLSRADQPMVKTKDAYIHRQAVGQAQNRQHRGTAPQAKEHIRVDQSTPGQPTIRTKGNDICQYGIGSEKVGRGVIPGQISEDSSTHPSQALERSRQSFVRERESQMAARRMESQGMSGITSVPTDRQSTAGGSSPTSRSGFARTETLSTPKTVRETRSNAKRPVKTARSERISVRKSKRQKIKSAVGSPGQTAKMADRSTRAAQQVVRANLQARQRAVKAAGRARQAAATVDRPMVRAAASALRGAVSGIRVAMAPLAAGGGAVLAVILVLCLVAALVMSPLGVFFGGGDGGGQTMADAVREINQEYSARLEELKSGSTYDQLSMTGTRAPWPEVMAVYAVKTTSDPTNGQEVVAMTDEKKELLKQVFWDMNELSSFTSTVPGEGDEEDTTTLHITVSAKTADEMADIYSFNASQRQQLTELLSDEYRNLWNTVLYGIGTGSGEIVAVALSQVGNVGGQPYWSWYGFPSRVEWCACFVSWCANECGYIEAGVIPKFAGCIQGSRWFKERGLWQDRSYTPNPGDIIFFDWHDPDGSSGPQDGVPDHVGIVERVENGRVYTIEGNSGDRCCQRSYPVGYYEVYGYGQLYLI